MELNDFNKPQINMIVNHVNQESITTYKVTPHGIIIVDVQLDPIYFVSLWFLGNGLRLVSTLAGLFDW